MSENGTIKPLLSQLQHLNTHFIELSPFIVSKEGVWSDNCIVNRRRIVEASHHLLHAGKDYFGAAVDELCDLDTICAHIIAGNLHDCLSSTIITIIITIVLGAVLF